MTITNNTTEVRPWLKSNGSLLSDEKIKAISKSWSPETWDLYLTETVEQSASYQREGTVFRHESSFDHFSETIWEGQDSDRMDEIGKGLRRICQDHLTPQQQHIIRSTFWNGLSERSISELLGISRSTVRTQKLRSLEKIREHVIRRKLLTGGRHEVQKELSRQRVTKSPPTNPTMGEGVRKSLHSTSNAENIERIYKQEIEKHEFVFTTGGDL